MLTESPIVITAALISSVVGLLTIIGVGIKIVSHLASIDATCEMSLHQFTGLKTEITELRTETKDDSDKQWKKISDHDVGLATLNARISKAET